MTFGTRRSDQRRTRFGLVFLVLGLALVLWAWGSWVYRASYPPEKEETTTQNVSTASADTIRAVRASPLVLLVGLLLVLLALFGSHALIRAARRYRALALRKRPPPTPADDVWAMNKLRNREDEEL